MKKWIYLLFSLCFFSCISAAWAGADDQAAQTTIENWFAAMKNGQLDKASEFLAPEFVSIHTDGIVRNKEQEIQLMQNLHVKDYHLSNFKFSQSNDTMVVTYMDKTAEKIDNEPVAKTAAGRMAVLQRKNNKWIIIAYANLDKIR
jgi:hypothetical protein